MVEIIRAISRGGQFHLEGVFYNIPKMEIAPIPAIPAPIYFGGLVDAVLRRAARLGEGYIWWENVKSGTDAFPVLVRRLHGYLAEEGRDPAEFEIKAFPSSVGLEALQHLAAFGATDLIVMPWLYYPGDPLDRAFRIDSVHRFARDFFPEFGH
jgi:alkanesulfonate monooxygenase SsuD/methylene tetrahydromethanopterin reductase-like flavin-dependent oxidoreductase (luciferase family)